MKRILLLLLLTLGFQAYADTRYVVDQIFITLRAGPSNEFRVLKTLKSGDSMDLLEEQEEYSRVMMADGTEGWVKSKYIDPTPIAAIALVQANQRVEQLEKSNAELKEKITNLNTELKTLTQDLSQAEKSNKKLTRDFDKINQVAAKPIEVAQQNEELLARNQQIEEEILELRRENETYANTAGRGWFMAGAGVVVLGLAIGLIIPRIRWRKSSSYWG